MCVHAGGPGIQALLYTNHKGVPTYKKLFVLRQPLESRDHKQKQMSPPHVPVLLSLQFTQGNWDTERVSPTLTR